MMWLNKLFVPTVWTPANNKSAAIPTISCIPKLGLSKYCSSKDFSTCFWSSLFCILLIFFLTSSIPTLSMYSWDSRKFLKARVSKNLHNWNPWSVGRIDLQEIEFKLRILAKKKSYWFVISAASINREDLESGFLSSSEKLSILSSNAKKQVTSNLNLKKTVKSNIKISYFTTHIPNLTLRLLEACQSSHHYLAFSYQVVGKIQASPGLHRAKSSEHFEQNSNLFEVPSEVSTIHIHFWNKFLRISLKKNYEL